MRSAARAKPHQAAYAWQAGLPPRRRPCARDVLPQGIEASAGQQPAPDWLRRPGRVGGPVSPDRGHGHVWHGPGHQQRPYGGFHTDGVLTPDWMESAPLVHPLTHPFHVPARPLPAQDVAQRPRGGGQGGDEEHPIGQDSSRRARRPSRLLRLAPHPAAGGR